MPKYEYNPNNTEGTYPTSIDFIDTEIKKDDKIVATDLVDLYDTYPESQTPNQGDALVYDDSDGIWKPGAGVGTGLICNIFEGYNHFGIRDWEERNIVNDDYSYYGRFAYCVCNGMIYMICGSSNVPREELNEYNPETNTTRVISSCPFIIKFSMISDMVSHNNKLYLFLRSYNSGEDEKTTIWIYDLELLLWEEKVYNYSFGYLFITWGISQVIGDYVYMYTRKVGTNYTTYLHRYDIINNTWSTLSTIPFEHPSSGFSTASHNNKFYVYGGTSNYQDYYDEIFEYDIISASWRIVSSGGKLGRLHLMDFVGDDLYIFGGGFWTGSGDIPSNDFWVYEFDNDNWYKIEGHDVQPRPHGGMSVIDDYNVFIYGDVGEYGGDWGYLGNINTNLVFIDKYTLTPGLGTFENPFRSLNDCFDYLNTCNTIPDEITLTIQLLSDITNIGTTSLNHPHGYNITINGDGYKIINQHDVTTYTGLIPLIVNNICSIGSTTIALIYNIIYYTGSDLHDGTQVNRFVKDNTTMEWRSIFSEAFGGIAYDLKPYVIGKNDDGQLGIGHNNATTEFTELPQDNVDDIITGDSATFIIKTNGDVYSAGSIWQLGIPHDEYTAHDYISYYYPIWLGGCNEEVLDLSCGQKSTLILMASDGRAMTAGESIYNTGTGNKFDLIPSASTGNIKVSCYEWENFIIKSDGSVICCGYNLYGSLGVGDDIQRDTFVTSGISNVRDIYAGLHNTFAITNDGSLWYCGRGNNNIIISTWQRAGFSSNWTKVGAISQQPYLLNSSGEIWVYNIYTDVFTLVDNSAVWIDISIKHAIKNDGTLWFLSGLSITTQIGTDTDWEFVCDDNYGTVSNFIKTDGTIWGLGTNDVGQLGLGDIDIVSVPTKAKTLTNERIIKGVGAPAGTMILKEDGSILGTGWDDDGQIGYGLLNTLPDQYTHIDMCFRDCKQLRISSHSNGTGIAIKNDGTLWVKGDRDATGMEGHDDLHYEFMFIQLGTDNDWEYVSCYKDGIMAIKNDGTLWGAGDNSYGQLGNNSNTNEGNLIQIGTDTDWKHVDCGESYQTFVIKEDGTLWVTGRNNFGQLGLGDNIDRNVFTQVGTDTDWEYSHLSSSDSFVIKSDGTVWAAGRNNVGVLGVGTTSLTNTLSNSVINGEILNDINSGMKLTDNHSIKEIKNVTLDFDLIYNDDVHIYNDNGYITIDGYPIDNAVITEVRTDVFHLDVYNLSVLKINNTDLLDDEEYMYIRDIIGLRYRKVYFDKLSIDLVNKSYLNSNSISMDKLRINNSVVNVENMNELLEWDLWNDSTLIINQIPNVYPTIDNYESTYIINGIQQ